MQEASGLLLVDDEELTLEMLAATLEGRYRVVKVLSGEEALEKIDQQPFDLVLMDVDMGGISGYEACQRLKAHPAAGATPVIFLSARTTLEERLQGYAAGGDDYVTKPFDPTELQAKIERVLQQRQRAAELEAQLTDVTMAVLSSADMVGEAGVVMEFQRNLTQCHSYEQIAQALFDALSRYGLEGCVRLRGPAESVSLNVRGVCTALENSILDHLQQQNTQGGARIRPMGQHTSFNYDTVLVFIRNLPMERPPGMDPTESERVGRMIDNVGLLVEATCSRVAAVDSVRAVRDLADVRHLVTMTREALADIAARNMAMKMEVRDLCDKLREDFEAAFMHLGLTSIQEDQVNAMLVNHASHLNECLDRGQQVEEFLRRVIHKLSQGQ